MNEVEIRKSQKYLMLEPLDQLVVRLNQRRDRLTRMKAMNAPACLVARENLLVECATVALSQRTSQN